MKACIAAHADGQVLRTQKRLLGARQQFLACAIDSCPDLVRKDCTQFLADVSASMPTLVLAAVDNGERDLTRVSVELDGHPLTSVLDGSALALDPGEHRVTFRAPDGRVREYRIVARENEKGRRLVAHFESANAKSGTARPLSVPPLAYALGGVGVLALGSFTYFGLRGRSTEECAPSCSRSEVDSMRTQYLAADISLAVGAAALGAATYVFFSQRAQQRTEASQTARVQLRPPRNGRGLSLEARLDF
ncbi:MAG TPA: hypothetical protein VK524_01305 [Polyangiaceae bacterium]|nr:hypothetical protein [Polyangiaceae bacterium]